MDAYVQLDLHKLTKYKNKCQYNREVKLINSTLAREFHRSPMFAKHRQQDKDQLHSDSLEFVKLIQVVIVRYQKFV